MKGKQKNALIVFTREPAPGKTKTRLMPYYTPEQCAELHKCFLMDIAHEIKKADADIYIAYTDGEPVFIRRTFGRRTACFEQTGDGLGVRMENAIGHVLGLGYDKAVLIGTDIPELRAETVDNAFAALDDYDIVIGATTDGGYYLIGMKDLRHEAFDVKLYGVSTVYEETVSSMEQAGLSVAAVDAYNDIDEPSDIAGLRRRLRESGKPKCLRTCGFAAETARISVIIPVYNESLTIDAMLRQMGRCSGDAEVIFVDGDSTDDTAAKIEEAIRGDCMRLIRCAKGRGRQLNAGALASSGDILFFLHCDSVLPEGWMDEIRLCMRRHSFGCFGVRFPSHNPFMLSNRIISNHRAWMRGLPFGDQGIFIDRELFFRMGMFPELPLMEDYEFSRRMKCRGFRPGMTRHRIQSSARRYGSDTLEIIRTEYMMWHLRRLFVKGTDPEILAKAYQDIR